MTVTKEAFVDLHEKYTKVIKLIEEDSKLDPDNEPFLSKYAARQILIGMKANLENLLRNQTPDTDEHVKLTAMLGTVYLYLGIIAISIDIEELSSAEKNLEKCIEIIEKYKGKPEVIMVTLNTYNQIGILWSQKDTEKSKLSLEKAKELYETAKQQNVVPIDISELFSPNGEKLSQDLGAKNFEKLYTLTLYYLAQIYGVLKDALKSAVYCHITLKRQLETDDYEPIDWALNAATLSQFFMEQNGFKQARHHLSASTYILEKYEKELEETSERNEAYEAKKENYRHRYADVARCWAKYGILLLQKSKERLLNHSDDIESNCTLSTDLTKLSISEGSGVNSSDLQNLYFPSLDLSTYEIRITDQFVLILQDARQVFLNIQTWLRIAIQYYTLETLASDYIEIVQDQSQMYLSLLFFEENPDNQAKLNKRRADLLEAVIKEINPKYYLIYCRQIWYELAQIYSDILDIKSEKLKETNERPTPQQLSKINSLIDKSIINYRKFIDSFKDSQGVMPKRISEDFEKPFLQALFHIAALSSKFISNKETQLKNTEESLATYNELINYCTVNPKAQELIPMEISICKEMVTLLPIKVAKLQQEVLNHS